MARQIQNAPERSSDRSRACGFTLVELLVVLSIITLLVAILLPVVHKVRIKAYIADTQNEVKELGAAIDRYDLEQHAYPGPLANDQVYDPNFPFIGSGGTALNWPFSNATLDVVGQNGALPANSYDTTLNPKQITMSENLVLGLLGGLWVDRTTPGQYQLHYDPSQVGLGPQVLSTTPQTHRYTPYMEGRNLSWNQNSNGKSGYFVDGTGVVSGTNGSAYDSIIPEFVDRFPEPLPILYLRAKPGISSYNASTPTSKNNPIITDDPQEQNPASAGGPRDGVYDINQIAGYTRNPQTLAPLTIGGGKESVNYWAAGVQTAWPSGVQTQGLYSVNPSRMLGPPVLTTPAGPNVNYYYPFDAYPYFTSPTASNVGQNLNGSYSTVARNRDGYILITAGEDRIYGTTDDITSFGDVVPQ
jgi:prepilin-type N-terminal cleavage/methylation domain-containing protein